MVHVGVWKCFPKAYALAKAPPNTIWKMKSGARVCSKLFFQNIMDKARIGSQILIMFYSPS